MPTYRFHYGGINPITTVHSEIHAGPITNCQILSVARLKWNKIKGNECNHATGNCIHRFVQAIACTFYLKHCHSNVHIAKLCFPEMPNLLTSVAVINSFPEAQTALRCVQVQCASEEQQNRKRSQKIVNVGSIQQWNKSFSGETLGKKTTWKSRRRW
jgi:hypothetical protein